jgi:hypothetical protein
LANDSRRGRSVATRAQPRAIRAAARCASPLSLRASTEAALALVRTPNETCASRASRSGQASARTIAPNGETVGFLPSPCLPSDGRAS